MELKITMIPALEDPSERGPDYQRQLAEFAKSLRKAGVEYEAGTLLLTETSPFIYAGRFVIKRLQTPGPVGGILGAWLQAKSGRKVCLKVGEIEAEAHTAEEVEKLLNRAVRVFPHPVKPGECRPEWRRYVQI
jgi:hypothetical protein